MSDNLIKKIHADLLAAIKDDSLVLPTLPEIALDVRAISEDEEASIMDLVEVIKKDTAITAKVIKVTNSPLLRGSKEITNLNMATSRLGMNYTCSLATGLAMEQMFQATSEVVDTRMRSVWKRSTEVAGLCNLLARQHKHLDPGQATLGGLVHCIGTLPILRYVEEQDLHINSVILDNLIDELQPVIGTHILNAWDFPSELRQVPAECFKFDRQVERVDYADLAMVALLQNVIGSQHHYLDMDWESISAFDRVGISSAKEHEEEDLSAEMEAAMAMLAV